MARETLLIGKGSSADEVWPGKQGWQSITNKEGSTASGAVLTVKRSGARGAMPGEVLLAKGSNASGAWLTKKESNAGEHC